MKYRGKGIWGVSGWGSKLGLALASVRLLDSYSAMVENLDVSDGARS